MTFIVSNADLGIPDSATNEERMTALEAVYRKERNETKRDNDQYDLYDLLYPLRTQTPSGTETPK